MPSLKNDWTIQEYNFSTLVINPLKVSAAFITFFILSSVKIVVLSRYSMLSG